MNRVARIRGDRPPSSPGTLGHHSRGSRQCSVSTEEMSPETRGREEWRAQYYGRRGLDPTRCAHRAEYKVDGREVCSRHAGMLCLEIMLREKEQ